MQEICLGGAQYYDSRLQGWLYKVLQSILYAQEVRSSELPEDICESEAAGYKIQKLLSDGGTEFILKLKPSWHRKGQAIEFLCHILPSKMMLLRGKMVHK